MAKDSSSLMTLGLVAVGGYFAYEYFIAPSTVAVSSSSATVGTTGGGSGAAASASGINWVTIYSQLVAATLPDTQFSGVGGSRQGTPYQWNFYLSRIISTPLPDLSAVFGNIDFSAPMTAATYWSAMGAALGAPAGSLPSPISAVSGQQAAGTSIGTGHQAPGYAYSVDPVTIMNSDPLAGGGHSVRGTTGAVVGNGSLAGFGAISCADVDPSFMGPVDCTPTPQQNSDFIGGLEDSYNALLARFNATPQATGLAAVPWWAWAGGAALFVAAIGSGGRR